LPAGANVFVTGGSGFLGRQLIRDLKAAGFGVRALARSKVAAATVSALGAEPVMGDLDDVAAMRAGMKGCTAVIHSAAKVELWGPWEDFLRVTVTGTENVIRAARDADVGRFVHISTEAVLADGKAIVDADETRPLPDRPNGFYPRSKGIAEQRVLAANGADLETVIVRPRFIWGEGDTTLLPKLAAAMRSGAWAWFGDDDHQTSTCNVRNVSHGVMLAAQFGRGGEIYFLTDGEPVPFRPFISRLVQTQGVDAGGRSVPLWIADVVAVTCEALWRMLRLKGEPPLIRTAVNLFFRQVTVNDAKARRELGYRPVVSIDEGLDALRHAAASA
jgi:nucleoside-diphosphate-sugar epimerase